MGGTGSLRFCSDKNNYKLFASRRNAEISGEENGKWGFTLVRRRPPARNEKSSRYEYLAPKGKIPEMNIGEVLIYPNSDNEPYTRPTDFGTIIKLFEYQLPGATKTMATTDFYRALSNKLWDLVVPIRIYETRSYSGHTLQYTFSGMNIRLDDDKGEVLEEGFPCPFSFHIQKVGKIDGKICLFKKEAQISRWLSSREAVIFTVNGQAHGSLPNDFFRRESVKLPWIQKELLINIDCSTLEPQIIERLFMTSRDRLCESEEKKLLEETLADYLQHHEGLRQWNEKRHQEMVNQRFHESDESKKLFEKLIETSPLLANFLGIGNKIKIPKPGHIEVEEFKGRRFPTFLKIENSKNGNYIKQCPQNSYCRVTLLTDAENDYFIRAFEPGKLILLPSNFIKSYNLYNGKLELQLQPDKIYPIGSFYAISVLLTSPEALEGYFKEIINVEIIEPTEKQKHPPKPPKPPTSTTLALPNMVEIYKDGWGKYEINCEEDVVTIMKDEQETTSLINMDNKYFLSYIYQNSKKKEVLSNLYKISSTIIGLVIDEQVEMKKIQPEQKRDVINSIGKVMLPLIDSLGDMKTDL